VDIKDAIAGQLIVSCQALPDEPLFGSAHMAAMSRAAAEGGAAAIRANTPADISAIRQAVALPIIGLYKIDFPDSDIYITPDLASAQAVAEAGADIIAIDATARPRPGGVTLASLINYIHDLGKLVLADISTLAEALEAERLGADFIATTMAGYTPDTAGLGEGPAFDLLAAVVAGVKKPVIAEGRIKTPAQARQALALGAHAVVVGGAITRPQHITRAFARAVQTAQSTGVAVGLDIGGTFIKAGLVNRQGQVLYAEQVPCPATSGPPAIIEAAVTIIGRLLKQISRDQISGVGVGSAGQIDYQSGRVVSATDNIPGWGGTPLGAELSKRLGLPVLVDNDANVAALGEAIFGAARGAAVSVTLTLGTGVGGGIVINGNILRGAHHIAGNLGHLKLSLDGPACTCGQQGCLESYVSSRAILERAANLMDRPVNSIADIAAAAQAGNQPAKEVLHQTGYYLGAGISNIINLVDPDITVLAGGIAQSGQLLLQGVAEAVGQFTLPPANKESRIELSSQSQYAGIIGSSCLVWEAVSS